MLARITSLMDLTFTSTKTPQEFREAFRSRVISLAKAHDLLVNRNMQGVEVEEILVAELGSYKEGGRKVRFKGPALLLEPRQSGFLLFKITED